jgi:hypothetical protein
MTRNLPFFKIRLPWIRNDHEVQTLSLQIESKIKDLNDLPSTPINSAPDDIASILKSTNLLLDRFIEKYKHELTKHPSIGTLSPEPKISEPSSQAVQQPDVIQTPDEPSRPFTIDREPEPSTTARELIKLRDYILLACTENATSDRKVFESLYQKVGQILTHESVTVLEETGQFNYEHQQVIDTQTTDDQTLDEMISSTIRSGYLFNQKLLRPQEVIVYVYTPPASVPSESSDEA